jgi:hypothetical protein
MSKPKRIASNSIATDNLGIIAGRALHYWRCLPMGVKCWYEPEDMIAELVTEVLRAAPRYDATRALPSTFVYRVADSKAQIILQHYHCAKYTGVEIPVEEQPNLKTADNAVRLRESRNAVERVIQYASPKLRNWLTGWLTQSNTSRRPAPTVTDELLQLSKQHGVNYRDFQLVFRQLVAE